VPRIALVTARRARGQVEEAARRIREATGWVVDVVEAPVEVAALIPRELLRRIILENRGRFDVFIVPGGLEYDVRGLGEELGVSVVRGPRDAAGLEVLAELGEEGLRRLLEEGELGPGLLLEAWLRELGERHRTAPGVEVCGVRVPLRPPPVLLAAEVYVRPGMGVEEAVEKARRVLEEGADIVVAGLWEGVGREEALEVLHALAREAGGVAVDTADEGLALEAFRRGYACMYMSVGLWNRGIMARLPRGSVVVVTPVEEGFRLPGTPTGRVEVLQQLVREAEGLGLQPIVDPVLDAPGQGSLGMSIAAYHMASAEMRDKPLMAGIANVYEMLDADTHGQIAVLTQVLAEAGASLLLVTEESRKASHAVAEARIAATMTSLSLLKRRPPKDLGIDLLYAKEKRPREPGGGVPRSPRHRLDAATLAAWHGFRLDHVGSHRIRLEDGAIRDYYIGRKGTILVEGQRAEHLYKAAAYLGLASEPSHYAYLGYELCKAEHALIMDRSYVQEEPLLTPPWARGYPVYVPRQGSAKRLGGEENRAESEEAQRGSR